MDYKQDIELKVQWVEAQKEHWAKPTFMVLGLAIWERLEWGAPLRERYVCIWSVGKPAKDYWLAQRAIKKVYEALSLSGMKSWHVWSDGAAHFKNNRLVRWLTSVATTVNFSTPGHGKVSPSSILFVSRHPCTSTLVDTLTRVASCLSLCVYFRGGIAGGQSRWHVCRLDAINDSLLEVQPAAPDSRLACRLVRVGPSTGARRLPRPLHNAGPHDVHRDERHRLSLVPHSLSPPHPSFSLHPLSPAHPLRLVA